MATSFASEVGPGDESESPELTPATSARIREMVAIFAGVVLADLTVYRGGGYAGLAVATLCFPVLLYIGHPQPKMRAALWVVGCMLVLIASRLLWLGSLPQVVFACGLVIAFATAAHGHRPFLIAIPAMASQAIVFGGRALWQNLLALGQFGSRFHRRRSLNVVLPALAFLLFGTLFILANPDAVTFVGRQFQSLLRTISEWLVRVALRPTEPLFWIAIAWILAGLLRPVVQLPLPVMIEKKGENKAAPPAPLYTACRNTLLTVIALFATYLLYEYHSLWTREFPEGFYYAGYAHEGAAWLTVALALSTLILSLVFSGSIRQDSRLPKLRSLAWVWSVQNLLLSLAVYNRLFIYIDFNGLTHMRIVGLFGITLVVVGFLLVLLKIARERDFAWLIQRQLYALVIAVYVFVLTPVDAIAVSYNVRRILDGDPSASMQIGVHDLDLEGVLCLPTLLECPTLEIRNGVAALIADRYLRLVEERKSRVRAGWTAHQVSDRIALERFEAVRHKWKPFEDNNRRSAALQQFHDFAYQWY